MGLHETEMGQLVSLANRIFGPDPAYAFSRAGSNPYPPISGLSAVCGSALLGGLPLLLGKMGQTARHSMPMQMPTPECKKAPNPL